MADEDEGEASPREAQRLHAQAPEPRPAVGSAIETAGDPAPAPGVRAPVTPELATPHENPGEALERPPAQALGAGTVQAGRDGPDPKALVEGLRENLARAGTATRGTLERAQHLAGRAIERVRDGTGETPDDAEALEPSEETDGRRPPVPPTDEARGPRTPVLDARRARESEANGDAPDEGFRLLVVGPASPDEQPPTPSPPELVPVRAPDPGHRAPPARPSARGTRVPADVEAGPPVQAPTADEPAPPSTPPTVDEETTVPVSEADEDDQGLIARLRDRLSSDERDETAPDDAQVEEETDEPEDEGPGLLASLRERLGGSKDKPEVEVAEQAPELEDEPPRPSPSVDRARPGEPAQHAPEPPSRGEPIPARPTPSTEPGAAGEDRPAPERALSPTQARRHVPAASPTPAPPAGEDTIPAQPTGTATLAAREAEADEPGVDPAPEEGDDEAQAATEPGEPAETDAGDEPGAEDADDPTEPAPEEEATAEEPAQPAPEAPDVDGAEDLHDRIDEVLDRHERRPGSVLAGRSSPR